MLPAFRELAPTVHHIGKLTLADLQAHQYYKCRLEFHDEVPSPSSVTRMDPSEEESLDDCCNLQTVPFDSSFPRFQPSDVEVVFDDPSTVFEIIHEKVFVQGQELFWKPSWISDEFVEAVEKYSRIHQSGLCLNQFKTPRMYGVVMDSKGVLWGQLYHWIDIDYPLTWEVVEQAPVDVREKRASQIKETVSTLHRIGVVWGDVKADNVVIDRGGNAIAIDFEGGATKGWVDEDKMGTKEDDVQGLERLVDYTINDSCPIRIREKEKGECT